MISFSQVTKKFGTVTALEQVDLVVNEGEMVFVTGPSGSGKTTVVRLILREILPTSGEVKVLGKSLKKMKGVEVVKLRRDLGVVWQDFKLIRGLTLFENVALTLRVRQMAESEIKTRISEVLEMVGLSGKEGFFPSQLAGGELQRTCLARAVVGAPKILLADEPTGNLDPETSWQIMNILKEVNKNGTTVVMATHNKEVVNMMQKRVIELKEGKVVKDEQKGKYGK